MAELRVLRPRKFVRSYVERTNLEALDVPTPQRVSNVISHAAHTKAGQCAFGARKSSYVGTFGFSGRFGTFGPWAE